MLPQKIKGYCKRLKYEFERWKWERYHDRNNRIFQSWRQRFLASGAQVVLGAHFHQQGGVRNHLLSIKKYSNLNVLLAPEEEDLQKFGVTPFRENKTNFLNTKPPTSAIAVHTHVLPWLIDWAVANAPNRLRWIHTHHALYSPEYGKNGIEPWQKELNDAMLNGAQNCDVCICVSRWEQKTLSTEYGIESHYVPNGVDISYCESANPQRFQRKYGVTNKFVLWVGRHDPVKNPTDFILLAVDNPALQFVMIGGITKKLIRTEYKLPLPNNLKLLPLVPRQDVLDAISACQTLVVTSLREGLPTLVLEAMTLQTQIIVPNVAGCLDATNGEDHARVYQLGNITQLGKLTREAYADTTLRAAARQRVLEEFDWRVVAKKLDQTYRGEFP